MILSRLFCNWWQDWVIQEFRYGTRNVQANVQLQSCCNRLEDNWDATAGVFTIQCDVVPRVQPPQPGQNRSKTETGPFSRWLAQEKVKSGPGQYQGVWWPVVLCEKKKRTENVLVCLRIFFFYMSLTLSSCWADLVSFTWATHFTWRHFGLQTADVPAASGTPADHSSIFAVISSESWKLLLKIPVLKKSLFFRQFGCSPAQKSEIIRDETRRVETLRF